MVTIVKGESEPETKIQHDSPTMKTSKSKNSKDWNQKEETRLLALVSRWKKKKYSKLNDECWKVIALHMVNENGETMGKSAARCKSRYEKIKKEDAMILSFYKKHEASNRKFDGSFFRREDFQALSKRIPNRTPLYLHRRYMELTEKAASLRKKTKAYRKVQEHRKHAYTTEAETRQDTFPVFMQESQPEERDCAIKEAMHVNNVDMQVESHQIQCNYPYDYKIHESDVNPNHFTESYPQNLEYNYPPFQQIYDNHAATAFESAIGGNFSPPAPSQHHQPVNNMIWARTPSPYDHQQPEPISFSHIFSTMLNSSSQEDESYINATEIKPTTMVKISQKQKKKQKRERKRLYKYLSRAKQPNCTLKQEAKELEPKEQDHASPTLDREASMDDNAFELGELSDETLFESLNQDFFL